MEAGTRAAAAVTEECGDWESISATDGASGAGGARAGVTAVVGGVVCSVVANVVVVVVIVVGVGVVDVVEADVGAVGDSVVVVDWSSRGGSADWKVLMKSWISNCALSTGASPRLCRRTVGSNCTLML